MSIRFSLIGRLLASDLHFACQGRFAKAALVKEPGERGSPYAIEVSIDGQVEGYHEFALTSLKQPR